MPTDKLTAATITAKQIRQLRDEALACTPADHHQVDLCDVALASREDVNDDGSPLVDSDGTVTTRTDARQRCADVINAARECDQHGPTE